MTKHIATAIAARARVAALLWPSPTARALAVRARVRSLLDL